MASPKKKKKIKLASTGTKKDGVRTGYFKTTTNSTTEKLKIKKYDPRAYNEKTGKRGMHVIFVQERIK